MMVENWTDRIMKAVGECVEGEWNDERVMAMSSKLRGEQDEYEEAWLNSLSEGMGRYNEAVVLAGCYGIVAAMDAKAKGGTLNGRTVGEFFELGWSAYKHAADERLWGMLKAVYGALGIKHELFEEQVNFIAQMDQDVQMMKKKVRKAIKERLLLGGME